MAGSTRRRGLLPWSAPRVGRCILTSLGATGCRSSWARATRRMSGVGSEGLAMVWVRPQVKSVHCAHEQLTCVLTKTFRKAGRPGCLPGEGETADAGAHAHCVANRARCGREGAHLELMCCLYVTCCEIHSGPGSGRAEAPLGLAYAGRETKRRGGWRGSAIQNLVKDNARRGVWPAGWGGSNDR